jgi:hypothetical protein
MMAPDASGRGATRRLGPHVAELMARPTSARARSLRAAPGPIDSRQGRQLEILETPLVKR